MLVAPGLTSRHDRGAVKLTVDIFKFEFIPLYTILFTLHLFSFQ